MNLHPLFVHFPIALLTIYALLECVRIKRVQQAAATFYVKAVLVIVGFVSSIATYLSGEAIEDLVRGNRTLNQLVETHSNFALATIIVFGILAAAYKVQWIKRDGASLLPNLSKRAFMLKLYTVSDILLKPFVCVPLAVLGLILVTITGALGGSIVYGPDVDPAVKFIYQLIIGT
jgi:uncharacterized membrane protein